MAGNAQTLKRRYLLIALLPMLVFVTTDELLHFMGDPVDELPPFFAPFDVHREATARLGVLGAFVLFVGAALGALGYFAAVLTLLARKLDVVFAFLVMVVVGAVVVLAMDTRQMQDYLGPKLICATLNHIPEPGVDRADPATDNSAQAKVKVTDQLRDGKCPGKRFRHLRYLLMGQMAATIFGVAALVLGSICCLAALPTTDPSTEELPHWEAQSTRLNNWLYLSALLLVTGLFFAAAYANWPAHALLTTEGYGAHANAFVAYLGFSYTLLIASYYAPVAAVLSAKVKALKPATTTGSSLPSAFAGPVQVLKIVAAIFSTTLAGALPSILNLGG